MSRPLLLNAFDMMVPVHQSPGLWRHPEAGVAGFDALEYWTSLARTLEEGGFTALFLADVPGVYDVYGGRYSLPGAWGFSNQLVLGGIIEAGANYCSHNMKARLESLGIPARYNFRPEGTHTWGYWEDALKDSWPTLAAPLGI